MQRERGGAIVISTFYIHRCKSCINKDIMQCQQLFLKNMMNKEFSKDKKGKGIYNF